MSPIRRTPQRSFPLDWKRSVASSLLFFLLPWLGQANPTSILTPGGVAKSATLIKKAWKTYQATKTTQSELKDSASLVPPDSRLQDQIQGINKRTISEVYQDSEGKNRTSSLREVAKNEVWATSQIPSYSKFEHRVPGGQLEGEGTFLIKIDALTNYLNKPQPNSKRSK